MAGKLNGDWSGDDILATAGETYALLPRPSRATTAAFLTLLREYWPNASKGTRMVVAHALRSSRRANPAVLEALELCELGGAAAVGHAKPVEEPSPADNASLVASAAADHARETMRQLAQTGDAGPEIQRVEIARRLRDALAPARDLADLLRLPADGAAQVLGDARGVIVALKALGIERDTARGFVARWHAAVPPGFEEAYDALSLAEAHDVVASWRGAALLVESERRREEERDRETALRRA